jgi:FixJ family two-component response regulator
MLDEISAILAHGPQSAVLDIQTVLRTHGVETVDAKSCSEARELLEHLDSKTVVFTDPGLADGTWEDVVGFAARARRPVIVVSPLVDIKLYVATIERGAVDFIVPPISFSDLAYVVQGATGALQSCRLGARGVAA